MEQVCGECNKIFQKQTSVADARAGRLRFKRDFGYLNSTQSQGCLFCTKLKRRWDQSLPPDLSFTVRLEGLDGYTPKLHVFADETQNLYPTVSYLVYATKVDPAASFIKVHPVNLDVASPATFEQAKSWLAACDDRHAACNRWMSKAVPLRVLDVSGSSEDDVCLLETHGQALSFAALSYCWGPTEFLTTRSVNLSKHMRGMQLSTLPSTIQDAIACTRRLGLKYIWIDALCIVQDDDVEKNREISRMKNFYRSAYVTISAASARTCHDGFLQRRQSYDSGLEVAVTCPDGRRGHVQLVELHRQPHPRFAVFPGAEPISYRAWTTQESLLSSRVLIYARMQVFWLCRQSFASDGGNMTWREFSNDAAWLQLDLKDTISDNERGQIDTQLTDKFDEYHYEWLTLVMSYSGRGLTYQQDKLLALSAIASLFHEKMQVDYICGLWRKSILFDITWAPAKHWSDRKASTNVYTGPSWSWIAHPDLVRYVYDWKFKKELAQVVSITVTPRYAFAPFGQVTAAEIVMKAPLFSLQPRPGRSSDWLLHTTNNSHVCTLTAVLMPDDPREVQTRMAAGETLYCVVLHSGDFHTEHATGLVLIRDEDAFTRIGRFGGYTHSTKNEQMLGHDGCTCLERSPESLRDRDVEVTRNLIGKTKDVITIS